MNQDQTSTAQPFEAWHVGRQGEASCGMTQVVNGYVRWSFTHCSVGVIESRDGSTGFRALWVYLHALITLMKLSDPRRQMLVVHFSQGGSFVREGIILLIAYLRGFGTIAHLHGSRFVDFASRWPWLTRLILSKASCVIVLSEATQAKVNNLLPNMKTVLVPNAVVEGKPVTKTQQVLFGGAVNHRKGIDVLLAAWSKLQHRGQWILKIAGPISPEFKGIALPDGVDMCGPLLHNNLMAEMEKSSIAVLPSRDEAMPMFILEAMARSNCVISTRVGGIPKVLDNGVGILVDPGNVDQLANSLDQAIQNESLRESYSRAAYACYDTYYSARAVYSRLEALWGSVLKL